MTDDAKIRRGADRIMRKVGPALYTDATPGVNRDNCLAPVRAFIGQGRAGGTFVQCSKRRRPGKKCCHWHRGYEEHIDSA